MRFVVFCLLVIDQKIIAFEPYRPFVGIVCGESENLDLFFVPSKSCVACRHDQHRVCQRACRLGGCSSLSEKEFEFDKRDYRLGCRGCGCALCETVE